MAQEKIFYYTEEIEKQLVSNSEYYEVNRHVLNECGFLVEGTLPNLFNVPNLMLSYLLSNNKFNAYNRLTGQYEIFDNSLIIDAFSIGFKEGRKGIKDQFDFPESMLDEKKANRNFKRLEAFIQKDELLKDNKICNLKPRTLLSSEFLNLGIASGKYFEILLLKEKYSKENWDKEFSKIELQPSYDKSKIKERSTQISEGLIEKGFNNLQFIQGISEDSRIKLLEKLSNLKLKEASAYLEEIGFFAFLDKQEGNRTKSARTIQKIYLPKSASDSNYVSKLRNSLSNPKNLGTDDSKPFLPDAKQFLNSLN